MFHVHNDFFNSDVSDIKRQDVMALVSKVKNKLLNVVHSLHNFVLIL
jgi:hypothetical protein